MHEGNLISGLQDTVGKVVPIRERIGAMPQVWAAVVHHNGYGWGNANIDRHGKCNQHTDQCWYRHSGECCNLSIWSDSEPDGRRI